MPIVWWCKKNPHCLSICLENDILNLKNYMWWLEVSVVSQFPLKGPSNIFNVRAFYTMSCDCLVLSVVARWWSKIMRHKRSHEIQTILDDPFKGCIPSQNGYIYLPILWWIFPLVIIIYRSEWDTRFQLLELSRFRGCVSCTFCNNVPSINQFTNV